MSDEDVDITSIEFTENNSIKLHMYKTISTIHTIDKKASLKELMSLIEQMKNYDAIKNEVQKPTLHRKYGIFHIYDFPTFHKILILCN